MTETEIEIKALREEMALMPVDKTMTRRAKNIALRVRELEKIQLSTSYPQVVNKEGCS